MTTKKSNVQLGAERFEAFPVNVRVKMSALWTAMLFVFAYVDIFSLFRPDFRAGIEAGAIAGFTINQSFLLATTIYILIPSLMVFGALVLRPTVNRIANIALSVVYALTIISAAIGEWNYFILGSAVEVALLAAIVYQAWTWPQTGTPVSKLQPDPLLDLGQPPSCTQYTIHSFARRSFM